MVMIILFLILFSLISFGVGTRINKENQKEIISLKNKVDMLEMSIEFSDGFIRNRCCSELTNQEVRE